MKKLLLFTLISIAVVSCSDDDSEPAPSNNCNINMSMFKDVTWQHVTGALADLQFASSGIYYENGNNDGNWSLSNGCDSIYVTRPSNNFYLRIISVTADSLHIWNPVFGDVPYYN